MATDGGQYQVNLIQMAALGRHFNLGDPYDYRDDHILSRDNLSWEKASLESATRIEHSWEKRFSRDFDFHKRNENLGLDSHLQMSVAAGFLNDFPGASNYINDRRNPSEAALTLTIRLKVREEHLDVEKLFHREISRLQLLSRDRDGHPSMTSHFVSGVFYGAEAYCVFTHDIPGGEADEEARKEIVQKLSKVVGKCENALSENQPLAEFKKLLSKNEKHLLTRIKCRFYADLQVEPVIECSFLDAYNHSLGLMEKLFTFPEKSGNNKAISIAVHLCPLNVLLEQTKRKILCFGCRDIDTSLTSRCSQLFSELKEVALKAEAVSCANKRSADSSKLQEFASIVWEYQEILKSKLKRSVYLARRSAKSVDDDVKRDIDKAFRHPFLRPAKLEHWLNSKRAELEMMEAIAIRTGTGVILAGKNQLVRQLKMFTNKKYSLVLFVPSLDEKTDFILSMMKKFYLEPIYSEDEEDDNIKYVQQPWHLIQAKRKLVLDRVQELAHHVGKNTHLQNQVQFIVAFKESNVQFGCNYSVYEDGKLLKKNLLRLPCPPTGLQIFAPKANSSTVSATWDYEELDFPCQFLIEHRRKGSFDPWTQQRMNEPGEILVAINSESELAMEFRVATDTCIGRSDFSDVVDAWSALDVVSCSTSADNTTQPPMNLKVHFITQTSVKLEWTNSTGINRSDDFLPFHVYVKCWKVGAHVSAQEYEFQNKETCCIFNDLQPNSKYFVTIKTDRTKRSEPTETIQFTTLAKDFHFGQTLLGRCKKIGKKKELDLYAVPLTKNEQLEMSDRFMFGEPNVNINQAHRTIMLIGTSDSDKTLLANSIVNYIFGVDRKDPFRFQLIHPSQVDDEDRITIYDIHHANGFRIDYSLTIIDIPSFFEDDAVKNKEIAKLVRTFFEDKNNSIQEVNLVGLVMDPTSTHVKPSELYVYFSLFTIFGSEVKKDVRFLFNCAEKQSLAPLLKSLSDVGIAADGQLMCHKLDSSFFAESSRRRVKSKDCEQWLKTFENFFSSLNDTKVVSLSKQILGQKKRLEATVNGLHDLMTTDLIKFQELSTLQDKIALYMKNEIVDLKLNVAVPHRFILPYGKYVTNCAVCKMTCHLVCGIKDECKENCDVMDHSNPSLPICRVCPKNCSWKMHRNEPFRWDNYQEKEPMSLDAIKERYGAKLKNLTIEELHGEVYKDLVLKKASLVKVFETVLDMIKRLNEIEKSLNPASPKLQCLNVCESVVYFTSEIIRIENYDKTEGNDKRIDKLIELRKLAFIYFGHPGNGGRNNQQTESDEDEEDYDSDEEDGEEEETEDDDEEEEESEYDEDASDGSY